MKLSPSALSLSVAALVAAGSLAGAQIERLDLTQMVAKTDNSLVGTIVGKEVIRIDHPVDGPELYYTTLTIQGTSLKDGKALTVDVTFPGGFIDAEHGVYNSEAPSPTTSRPAIASSPSTSGCPTWAVISPRTRCTRRTAVCIAPSTHARTSSCKGAERATRSRTTSRSPSSSKTSRVSRSSDSRRNEST